MLYGMIFSFQVNNPKKFKTPFFSLLVWVGLGGFLFCFWFFLFVFLSSVTDLCIVNFQKLN